jgi:hypothetical protein
MASSRDHPNIRSACGFQKMMRPRASMPYDGVQGPVEDRPQLGLAATALTGVPALVHVSGSTPRVSRR